jgi:hypothetical protein
MKHITHFQIDFWNSVVSNKKFPKNWNSLREHYCNYVGVYMQMRLFYNICSRICKIRILLNINICKMHIYNISHWKMDVQITKVHTRERKKKKKKKKSASSTLMTNRSGCQLGVFKPHPLSHTGKLPPPFLFYFVVV